MTNKFFAITASTALLGVAALNTGITAAHAQAAAVPASRIVSRTPVTVGVPNAAGSDTSTVLDFATLSAKTTQFTMTQWGTRPTKPGEKSELQIIGKEHVTLDSAGSHARFEQFDMTAPVGKDAPKPSWLVADGTTAYEVSGPHSYYFKNPITSFSKGIPSRTGLVPAGLSTVLGWNGAGYVTAPDETVGGKTLKVFVRNYSVRSGEAADAASFQYTFKIWEDPATKLPTVFNLSFKKSDSPDAPTTIQRLEFSDWKLNQPVDASLFAWSVPAGVTAYVAPVTPTLLAAGTMAPDFTAIKYGGGDLKLSDYRGKVVILDFWATWCGPCQRSMPHVQRVADAIKGQDVVVIGVCVWDDKDSYEKWVPTNQSKYTFQFAFDPAANSKDVPNIATGLFKVSGIPTTYIIGKDGKVVDAIVGYQDGDTRIEGALAKVGVKVPETTKVASAK